MIGAIAIVIFLLVVFPITIFASGAVFSALQGFFLQKDGEERHEGSELIELNR